MTELSDNERQLLAREVAADQYDPPLVADVADVLRVPRDSFIAGWDAAVAHLRGGECRDDHDESDALVAVLGKPTRWRDFVETLNVDRY